MVLNPVIPWAGNLLASRPPAREPGAT